MASRKTSLTLIDLEGFKELEALAANCHSEKYQEHSEIFHEICQEAAAEDHLDERPTRQLRRSSLSGGTGVPLMESHKPVEVSKLHRRRHSTFNPRNRAAHRREHDALEEHMRMLEDKQRFRRASFVNNLLEFSVNFDVSTSAAAQDLSPALNFSCPVLSYMNDDEEDSVELRMLRRPSLVSTAAEDSHAQSWESFKDDGETELPQDDHEMVREYIIELPLMEEVVKPRSNKRRKPHSYKTLEKRLTNESQFNVIKSFSLKDMVASIPAVHQNATSLQPKALDLGVSNSFQSKTQQPIAARQQCARGA